MISWGRVTIDEETLLRYKKAQYGIVGRHSAVQICSWTKKALRGKGVCYKQKFYGIDCHRCAQMSPAFAWCQECCVHCWRPAEWMKKIRINENDLDEPALIIDGVVKERRKLLCGIGGAKDVDKEKFLESIKRFPSHWAISLSGEPTIYPKIGELIELLRKNKEVRSVFLVTNGQEPDVLKGLKAKKLPTQLYLSISAPNEKLFKRLNRSVYLDGWERLQESIGTLRSLKCRTVIRLTLIRGVNDMSEHLPEYAAILERSKADFIEIKSYMYIGLSRNRLKEENMAPHSYVKQWAERLLSLLPSYRLENEDETSRIVLLKRKDSRIDNIIRGS